MKDEIFCTKLPAPTQAQIDNQMRTARARAMKSPIPLLFMFLSIIGLTLVATVSILPIGMIIFLALFASVAYWVLLKDAIAPFIEPCATILPSECAKISDFIASSHVAKAYYEEVILQARQFVKGDVRTMKEHSDAAFHEALHNPQYDLNGPALLTPLADFTCPQLSNSVFPDHQQPPSIAEIEHKHQSMHKDALSYAPFISGILSFFFMAALCFSGKSLSPLATFFALFSSAACGSLVFYIQWISKVSLIENALAELDPSDSRYVLAFCLSFPEGRSYRKNLLASGRRFIYEDVGALQRLHESVTCRSVYQIPQTA